MRVLCFFFTVFCVLDNVDTVALHVLLIAHHCTLQVFEAIVNNRELDVVYDDLSHDQRVGLGRLRVFVNMQRAEFGHLLPLTKDRVKEHWPLYFKWMHTFLEHVDTHNNWIKSEVQNVRNRGLKAGERRKREKQVQGYKAQKFNLLPKPNFGIKYTTIGVKTLPVCCDGVCVLRGTTVPWA